MSIVTINLNVLHSLMKDEILSNAMSRLAIAEKRENTRVRHTETTKKSTQPFKFSSDIRHGAIFSFRRRARNCVWFPSLPRDTRRTKKHYPICDGTTGERTVSPVGVAPGY